MHFHNLKGKANWEQAISAYEQALALDPEYALAWIGLAMTYHDQTNSGIRARDEGVRLAMEAVERALVYAPDLGRAWSVLGFFKKFWEWDWNTAQAAIDTARRLDPNSFEVLIGAASLATTLGQLDQAIELYEQAVLIDPLNLGALSAQRACLHSRPPV